LRYFTMLVMFYQCFCLSELRPTYSTCRLDRTGRYHNESLDSLTIIILYGNFLNIVISIYSLIIVFVRLVMFIKRICYVMLYVFFALLHTFLWNYDVCVCVCGGCTKTLMSVTVDLASVVPMSQPLRVRMAKATTAASVNQDLFSTAQRVLVS